MNTFYSIQKKLVALFTTLFVLTAFANAQLCEWRLTNPSYNGTDPDGAGPALGTASFTLQVRSTGANIPDVTAISVGWSFQSAFAMIPTNPGCVILSAPVNVTVSPAFTAGGYAYTVVNQCGNYNQTAGGQNFDKRAVGTMDAVTGNGVTLTTAWMDMFTVTLWTLSNSNPQGGYVIINSGAGGSPGEFTTYAISDVGANEYAVNSLTYNTPLPLGGAAPVSFASFDVKCSGNGATIKWSTSQEFNSDYFEVQRSTDGNVWASMGRTAAAGYSADVRSYNQLDLAGGNAMYRIKQVDKDGKITYSDIRRVNCDVKNITAVLYPVPAKDVLNVAIQSDKSVRTQLVIMDITGKLVRKLDVTIMAGSNNYKFNLSGLSSGEYLLRSTDLNLLDLNKKFSIIQ